MAATRSPYNLDLSDTCMSCRSRSEKFFCSLNPGTLRGLEAMSFITAYPEQSALFVEGQAPRGIYVLCRGRVKLSVVSADGKTLILRIAQAGEILGLSSCVLGKMHEMTAETLSPCQVNFVRREDFLRFLKDDPEACFRVAEQLSSEYQSACREIGSLGFSRSAEGKLANLLLDWMRSGANGNGATRVIKLTLTHEEMSQMIGVSRETITRTLAKFKAKKYIAISGSSLTVLNPRELETVAETNRVTAALQEEIPCEARRVGGKGLTQLAVALR